MFGTVKQDLSAILVLDVMPFQQYFSYITTNLTAFKALVAGAGIQSRF